MALITTVGGTTSDSYVSVAEADTYISPKYSGFTVWDDLDTDEKEFRLQIAALLMNTLPYRGAKACRSQRLEFPRWWRWDDGYPVTEDDYVLYAEIAAAGYTAPTIPNEIKNAHIEVAFHYVHGGVLQMGSMEASERPLNAFSLVGQLSVEFSDLTSGNFAKYSTSRMSSLDVAYFNLNKWLRRVSGGVV